MRTLSKHQVRSLLNSVDLRKPFGERDYLLMLFLYHTGLRVGEVSGLVVAHVVTRLRSADGLEKQPRQQLDLPAMICKGPRGRVIPLNSVARSCVSKIMAYKRGLGFSTAPAAPLFQNRKHGPLSIRSIQKLVKKYRLAADLDRGRYSSQFPPRSCIRACGRRGFVACGPAFVGSSQLGIHPSLHGAQ